MLISTNLREAMVHHNGTLYLQTAEQHNLIISHNVPRLDLKNRKCFMLLQCWKGYGQDVWYWTQTFRKGRHVLCSYHGVL